MTRPDPPSLDETAEFAARCHAGQVDKAGQPYVDHLRRVGAHLCRIFPRASLAERHAAWLHDVLEDTPVTAQDLGQRGYGDDVIALVQAVTKDPAGTQTYAERIETLARHGPDGAIRLKIADLTDNGDPARLAALPPDQATRLARRYDAARARLWAALDARTRRAP
ncbi:MAG: HD domain-containing protein [Marinibacterium sp.]|nr:HD domain-containing protein [Marinibacterium sp.]